MSPLWFVKHHHAELHGLNRGAGTAILRAALQNGICLSLLGNYDKRAKTDTGQDKPLYLRASTA